MASDIRIVFRSSPVGGPPLRAAQRFATRADPSARLLEQIMLGLIGEGTGIAAKVLKSMGTSSRPARRRSPLTQRFAMRTATKIGRGALSTVEACKP